ncbi:MAG: hypothetical protein F4Y58_00410 [Gammaproteobacteria bacterium]|nr:hypothetical protein [Gammaproteobacteria bacterium]
MNTYKCPFQVPQIKRDFACTLGVEMTRRDGVAVACRSSSSSYRCCELYEQLKQVALDAFDMNDDLLQVPQSLYIKVQYGGLLGLQRLLGDVRQDVLDISSLVAQLYERYGTIENVPCSQVKTDIQSCRLRRKR